MAGDFERLEEVTQSLHRTIDRGPLLKELEQLADEAFECLE